MDDLRIAYITVGTKQEARQIGKKLVEERLAACVNIIDGMESMYWWKDTIETDQEIILLAKTTSAYMKQLTEQVMALHPYDCPCVLSFSPNSDEGNPDYLQWLIEETGENRA